MASASRRSSASARATTRNSRHDHRLRCADIAADAAHLVTFKCSGCGAEVTVNTQSQMTARCHWCRHVFGVNEQVPNGAVPDAVLPFHIKKDDAVARIRQFVDKRRLFALKEFKEQFTPENVSPCTCRT
jgi:ribosomal protein S27E